MQPLLARDGDGWVLSVPAGDVDGAAAERGIDPDGFFWEGIARQLVAKKAPDLADDFTYDSDFENFAAEGPAKAPLERLSALLVSVCEDPAQLRRLIDVSSPAEFED